MYKIFYRMKKEPFENYPLTNVYYNSQTHHNAWKYIVQGISRNDPVLFVTGEYGTGKTLLCLKLVKAFTNKKSIPFVFIPTPNYSFSMILKKIIGMLEISSDAVKHSSDESELLNIIYDYFEKISNTNGKYIYIIIDEAQDISYSFANKLKLLTSFNCSEHFPFKMIIFGHMNFLEILDQRNLKSLRQRIKRVFFLQPFDVDETKEYIYFRLIYSGASGTPVFDDDAVRIIHSASAGIPRLINNLCDICLVEASSKKINHIGMDFVKILVQRDMDAENENISTSENHTMVQHTNGLNQNDDQENRYNTENNQIHQMQNNISPNNFNYNFTKEQRPEIEFIPEPENENKQNKSGHSGLKKISGKKTGLILVLILILAILSYILFFQIQSKGIPELNKKIGANFVGIQNQIVCYDRTKTMDYADITSRYFYMK